MLNDIKSVYAKAWQAAFVLPILFLIPAVVEFAQHVVELRTGMYDSAAAAKAVSNHPQRMLLGFAKTIALLLPSYWFVRFMAFAGPKRAARAETPAFPLWLVVFAMNVAILAFQIFGPSVGDLLGMSGQASELAGPVLQTAWLIVGIYFTAWIVAWTLGNRAIGPVRSFSVMAGSFWRTVGYSIAGILPLMAVHYGLSYLAIALTPAWLDWPVLVLDSFVVALLACCMAGSVYVAAASAAARKGVSLTE